jgi:5-methylcytosine-specific restriction endonuclease McrA
VSENIKRGVRCIGDIVTCNGCQKPLPFTQEFFKHDNAERLNLSQPCKKCAKLRHDRWKHSHRAAWRFGQYSWRNRNKNRWKQLKKESRLRNPLTKRLAHQRRKTRKRNLPFSYTASNWQASLQYFRNRCAVCFRKPSLDLALVPDHWIALADKRSDNPGTVPWNIVPLCSGCNSSKHDLNADLWLLRRFGGVAGLILSRVKGYFERVKPA